MHQLQTITRRDRTLLEIEIIFLYMWPLNRSPLHAIRQVFMTLR